jgi:phosphatidylserine decarboxylase
LARFAAWWPLWLREDLNFLLTNRIPRIALTYLMGWVSGLRSPWLTRRLIAVWRIFTPLDLSEAETQHFERLQDCFTRRLKPDARPFDPSPEVLCSPTDGIVGACGAIAGTAVWQAKGFPYTLPDLLGSEDLAQRVAGGTFVTLRLTSSMYHHFHAPADVQVDQVRYISGDTWNVNPIALARVERLFCKNERAVIDARVRDVATGQDIPMLLVPVAAVLVASLRFTFCDAHLHLRYRGPNLIPCDASLARGADMGWFEHGSTVIVLVPPGFALADGIATGTQVKAGQALLRKTETS